MEALSDTNGNMLTALKEWKIGTFIGNYAVVKENEKSGIINIAGKVTIPTVYDSLKVGKEYVVGQLKKDGKKSEWHVLQFSGEVLFKKDSQDIEIGNQGYFSFLENNSWGFYNYQGDKACFKPV